MNMQRELIKSTVACLGLAGLLIVSITTPIFESNALNQYAAADAFRLYFIIGLFIATILIGSVVDKDALLRAVPWPIWLAIAWCWASLTWSVAPEVSARRLILTTVTAILACFGATSLGSRRAILVTTTILLAAVVLNIVFVALFPEQGIHLYGKSGAMHQWRGFMTDKNIAGSLAAMTIIFVLFGPSIGPISTRLIGVAPPAILLIQSYSRTSVAACIIAATIGGLFSLANTKQGEFRRNTYDGLNKVVKFGGLAALLLLLIFSVHATPLLTLLDDSAIFSRRGEIWQPMLLYFDQHAWGGAGYGAYWSLINDKTDFSGSWLRKVTQGHNGYLDMLVQIGSPGLAIVVFATLAAPLTLTSRISSSSMRDRYSLTPIVVATMTFYLINNLMESSLFDRDKLPFIIATIVAALVYRRSGSVFGQRQTGQKGQIREIKTRRSRTAGI